MTSTAAQPEPTGELPAPDQTERVILRAAQEHGEIGCPCDMLVIGDTTGALTAETLELVADHPGARVLSWTRASMTVRASIRARRLQARQPPQPSPLITSPNARIAGCAGRARREEN